MADSWYENLARKGFLGTRAKVSADTKSADWSSKPEAPKKEVNQLEAMKRRQAKLSTTE